MRDQPVVEIEAVSDLDEAWPALRELFLELHRYHEPWLSQRLRGDWEGRWREFVALQPDRLILVAKDSGGAVAYLNAQVRRDYGLFDEDEILGLIDDTYVRADFRGRGLGRVLVRRCEAWCRSRGAKEVRLNVAADNQLGIDFWSKSGFSAASYLMSKSLEAAS